MNTILNIFIFIPLIGFIISLCIPDKKELVLSRTAFFTVGIHLISFFVFFGYWMANQHQTLDLRDLVILKTDNYEFFIDFCFDKITAVYFFVGALLTFMVTIYSKAYLHREIGYKRFFNTILFFYLGYNITIFAGNLETLVIGWEILGITSFLLIAFYRNRYLPVKNAIKVFSIYRIGDVGLILAMWASHHLWHENITFLKLSNNQLVHEHLMNHSMVGIFISLMILISAAAKSAQLPFSSWLPRAMEGPTPSSAIFYGSLSVHLGVFILLRTFPFWENQISVRVIIVILGLSTAIIASFIARVQSSVKSQIAYGSISQIGIIFIEVAAGFENLALLHFAGNAFLRTYQLLVSPSIVSYLIREQFYNYKPRIHTFEDRWPKKIEYSIYLLSIKEWNLDKLMSFLIWKPLKSAGRKFNFLTMNQVIYLLVPTYAMGLFCLYHDDILSPEIRHYLPIVFSLIGLIMVIQSFSERRSTFLCWVLIIMNHFWIALAISFNEYFQLRDVHIYLSGIVVCGLIGFFALLRLRKLEGSIDLNKLYGHVYEHPKIAFIFLVACLGLTGFPITPTFIGEDLIFSHIHEDQFLLALITSIALIIDGISLLRMYARLFLGPHQKTYHETPFKSS